MIDNTSQIRWAVRFLLEQVAEGSIFHLKTEFNTLTLCQRIFQKEQGQHCFLLPFFVFLTILLYNWCKRNCNEWGRMQFQTTTDHTMHESNKIFCLDREALWLDMNLQWHLWEQRTRLCQALGEKKWDSWCLSRLSHFLSLCLQWEIGGYHKS